MTANPNPYQAPSESEAPPALREEHRYQTTKPLVTTLVALFGAQALLFLVGLAADVSQIDLLERMRANEFTPQEVESNDSAQGAIAAGIFVALVATAVCFCMWMSRSNRNARALGHGHRLQFKPNGWVWFFVPFLQWFRPYRAVRELYEVSGGYVLPSIFPVWWALWVVQGFAGSVVSRLENSKDLSTLITATTFDIPLKVVQLMAAGAAIMVVRAVFTAQEDNAKAGSAP